MIVESKWKRVWVGILMVTATVAGMAQPAVMSASSDRLAWWVDARFGMFIHWGLYAQDGCFWQGRDGKTEHMMRHLQLPIAEYEQIAKVFNPDRFDAKQWVQIARDAGMKYMIITSKHHDGFAMFDSPSNDYNIVERTPFKRDVIRELAEACREGGLRFGVYYSLGRDWHDPDVPTSVKSDGNRRSNTWDFPDEDRKVFSRYFERKVKPQVKELLTQYGPIAVLWFDTPERISQAQSQELVDLIHGLQPDCIVNSRVGHGLGEYGVQEQKVPDGADAAPWETCMTLNRHWGYHKMDDQWKSTETLVRKLVDIASKGGNFLLNVGPTGLGVIPGPSVERLHEVGQWLKVNGESLYGTAAGPIQEATWGRSTQRVTDRGEHLYLHVFDWPADGKLVVQGLDTKFTAAHLLMNQTALQVDQAGETLTIQVPVEMPDPLDTVVVLTERNASAIRTPRAPETPRINGPSVFGVRPGSPFLYTIPATGIRPMWFAAAGLPTGLQVNAETGQITGQLNARGDFQVTLQAQNRKGRDTKPFKIVVGDTLALTPPMGWNSWNCWGPEVDAGKVLASAEAMVSSGLINYGWTYVNIDDAWQSAERSGPFHAIQGNEKFPDMKGLSDQIHAMGLKIGIYSTPWVTSYAGYMGGSADNAEGRWAPPEDRRRRVHGKTSFAAHDARQWAAWGIDYLKYDWNPKSSTPRETPEEFKRHIGTMTDALKTSGRDMLFSYSNSMPREWISDVGELLNGWRTTGDIRDEWYRLCEIGFSQDRWSQQARPGHWNDPDMLVVGHVDVGKGRHLHPSRLTPDEQYTHITLWALLAAPLLIGCDMENLDAFTLNLLTNHEVLAVNQDALGKQARPVFQGGETITLTRPNRPSQQRNFPSVQLWVKEMDDGSRAVGLFNLGDTSLSVTATWTAVGIHGPQAVRDLWRQRDLGIYDERFALSVAPHSAELVSMRAVKQQGGQEPTKRESGMSTRGSIR